MKPRPLAILAVVAVLALSAAAAGALAAAEPPAATLAQLEKALSRSDPESLGKPARATMHAVVAKPNGKEREEILTETVVGADGTSHGKLVRATKDGRDVTAEKIAESEKQEAARAKAGKPEPKRRASGEKRSLGLRIPTGDDRKLFVIGEPKSEGALLVVDYAPVRGAKGDDLSRGRIAWNAASGEPAFVEAQLVNPPTGLKELRIRGEFKGEGDAIYTSLLKTSGVGGLLWIKRKFEITEEMAPTPAP